MPQQQCRGIKERVAEGFSSGYRYEEARTRWRSAEALLGAGDRDGAREQMTQARSAARAMGARPLTAALDSLAGRARLDAASATRSGDVLTDREAEVLELVAQGLTNRERRPGTGDHLSPPSGRPSSVTPWRPRKHRRWSSTSRDGSSG